MNKEQLKTLEKADTRTLAKWWDIFNGFEWPDDFPGKPNDFDSLPGYVRLKDTYSPDTSIRQKHLVIDEPFDYIKNKIGLKECLRYHHISNLHRTNKQFEEWWEREHNHLL